MCRKSDLAVKRGSLASVAKYVDKDNPVLINEGSIFGSPTFPNVKINVSKKESLLVL